VNASALVYAVGLRGTLGHSSKEMSESSFGRLTSITIPLTTAPTTNSSESLKRVLRSPTKIQVSVDLPGLFVPWRYTGFVTHSQSELLL
jgi:predicted component of type VI protein secretion system